jgi:hypothetical protein
VSTRKIAIAKAAATTGRNDEVADAGDADLSCISLHHAPRYLDYTATKG